MCNTTDCSASTPGAADDRLVRVIIVSIQAVCIVITCVLAILVFHFRKYKVGLVHQMDSKWPFIQQIGPFPVE